MPLPLPGLLDTYLRRYPEEKAKVSRFVDLLKQGDDIFRREHFTPGHITGSAWLISPDGQKALLTHHKKLEKWLQPGGHSDGSSDTFGVALREAQEESGIPNIVPASFEIFDLDIHEIPARKDEPTHLHFDARFLLRAATEKFAVSEESHDLRWVRGDDIGHLKTDESVLKMAERWQSWLRGQP